MRSAALIAATLLAACAGREARCIETEEVVSPGDPTPLGITPQAVLDAAIGAHAYVLTYGGGGQTALTLELTDPGDPVWVDSRSDPDDGSLERLACVSRLEIPATLRVETEDGLFDESAEVTLEVLGGDGTASFGAVLDPFALNGAYRPARDDVDPTEWDSVKLVISGTIGGEQGDGGSITVLAEKRSGGDGEGFGHDVAGW